jgi:hypothetical protein
MKMTVQVSSNDNPKQFYTEYSSSRVIQITGMHKARPPTGTHDSESID